MATTDGNNTLFLDASNPGTVGLGLGNDRYVLNNTSLAANQSLIISDADGANTLQLVGGLTITSSLVSNNAIQLTLSNGAKVSVLGASTFTFLTGGDAFSGTGGVSQTFSQFVTTALGSTVPAANTPAVTVGSVTLVDPSVPVTPAFSVAAAAAAAEGTSATFTVSLSTAQAGATTVAYTLAGTGGAVLGTDTGVNMPAGNTGTLTFAAGETTKTVVVPITVDAMGPEAGEGVSLTLSAPSTGTVVSTTAAAVTVAITDVPVTYTLTSNAASVFEGAPITYTLTASAASTTAKTIDFSVVPGDAAAANQGTSNTNLNDFAAGAFNPAAVVLAAGATTATYTVTSAADSITELPENYSVKAVIGTTTVATTTTSLLDGGSANGGQTFTLTTGVDNIVGGAGNDVINATNPAAPNSVLGGLDKVDGGDGIDTLNIADTAGAVITSLTATVKNVENINFTTNNNFAGLNVSAVAGLTKFVGVAAAAAANSDVTVANTQDVALTVAGTSTASVFGGKAVSITAGTGNVIVGTAGALATKADAITSVSVKGGGTVDIDNTDATATTALGTTLTAVTLDGIGGATAVVNGAAIATVTLQNQKSALTTTVTNGTSTALTINADGVGYDATGAGVTVSVAAGSKAATLNVNATGAKSALTLTGALAKTVNITGSAALDLAQITTATKIDGSAATGNLNLNTLVAGTVNVKTGSGNDKFTADTTNKLTVDAGAGNDIVTLSGALVVGSTVNLGAGNDKLIGATAVIKAGPGLTDSVIDGGAGTDTVSAAMINAGNAALFLNFEGLSLNSTTGLDAALLTGSTLTALSIDSVTTTALYQNLSVAQKLDVSYVGDNSAFTNTLSFKDATGTADTFAIKFSADNSAATTAPTLANVKAGTIAAAGIENFTIESAGTKAWNSLTLGADVNAKTVVVTGAANLDLAFASFGSVTAPNTGVTSIDGSAATGKLAINVAGVTAATAGLTVKGGSAADTLKTSTFATTLAGGAGADQFVVALTKAGAVATVTGQVVTTIADAAATDIIDFGSALTSLTKSDVSTATALSGGTTNAFALAATTAAGNTAWFQYGGDTYIVADKGATASTFDFTDMVVKLTGLVDLTTATVAGNTLVLG